MVKVTLCIGRVARSEDDEELCGRRSPIVSSLSERWEPIATHAASADRNRLGKYGLRSATDGTGNALWSSGEIVTTKELIGIYRDQVTAMPWMGFRAAEYGGIQFSRHIRYEAKWIGVQNR